MCEKFEKNISLVTKNTIQLNKYYYKKSKQRMYR